MAQLVASGEAEEPLVFASLPIDLLCSVTEVLDLRSVARFAAACSAFRAATQSELRDALLSVIKRCLKGTPSQPCYPRRPRVAVSGWEKATFVGCNLKSLSLLHLGHAVGTSIGENSFLGCRSLSRCVLSTGITTIGQQAFRECTSLTEITLPSTLTSIDSRAFHYCFSLSSLTFPASLTTIGSQAFDACTSIAHLDFSALTAAVTIGSAAFADCERLVKLTLPAALSRIECSTFSCCKRLVEVTLPAALEHIDKLAFDCCYKLKTLIFPAALRLTYVGDQEPPWPQPPQPTPIETDCAPLTNLEITPTTLADQSAFIGCRSLSRLTLPGAPKVSESLRKVLPQLYRALFWQTYHGADPVPKLTWPAPTTLATTGHRDSRGCPRLTELQQQRPCPHYRYRRVRLLLQQLWKSKLEVWIAELEIRAGTAPGSLYSAESAVSTAIRPCHYVLHPW